MCRIFGFRSVMQSQVHRSLVSADNAFMRQSERHPDGWGVAYYVADAPHVVKGASAAFGDQLFKHVSGIVTSETVLAHLRKATQGELSTINTHPFQYGHWVFAHNGNIANFAEIRDVLLGRIPPVLRRFILGTTDSEVLFYLLLGKMAQRCELHRPGYPLADTYAGKIKGLKTGLVDTAAELSAKFGPALQAAGAIAMVTGTIMQIYAARQAAAALATEAGTAATIGSRIAMVATSAATKTMAAAQWLLNAALSANPIGLVVIAIAALVAGLIYAYQHSATFRAIVQGAMKAVGAAISWLWDNAAKPALHALGAAWKWLVKVITPAVKFIITAIAGLLHMWAQMLRGLSNVPGFEWAKKAATAMDRAAEKALGLARALGKLHDKKITVTVMQKKVCTSQGGKNAAELLQMRAKGGPVDRRTAYVIGEEGPEVYVPKSDGMVLPNEVYRNMVSGGRPIRSERTPFAASAQHDTIEVIVKTEDGRVIQQKLLKRKRELGGAVLGLA